MRVASTESTTLRAVRPRSRPSRAATCLEARADDRQRAWDERTAWRCMFEPISARFASSCSRTG